jgi:hypothetical protein
VENAHDLERSGQSDVHASRDVSRAPRRRRHGRRGGERDPRWGTTDANIERWLNQFDDRGKDTRAKKDVRGLKVTLVEVSGTYLGGGMMNSPSIPHPGWALLGAVVEAPGTPYFVKVTGPAATVRSARAAFDALIDSLTPS